MLGDHLAERVRASNVTEYGRLPCPDCLLGRRRDGEGIGPKDKCQTCGGTGEGDYPVAQISNQVLAAVLRLRANYVHEEWKADLLLTAADTLDETPD